MEFGSDSKKSCQFFDRYIIREQAKKYTSLVSIILLSIWAEGYTSTGLWMHYMPTK